MDRLEEILEVEVSSQKITKDQGEHRKCDTEINYDADHAEEAYTVPDYVI